MQWLERVRRWWSPQTAIIEEALQIQVEDLDRNVSVRELHVLCDALSYTTWNGYRHVMGRHWTFDTRIANIDTLLVMLFDITQDLVAGRLYEFKWFEDQAVRRSLYDFMSTERGFNVPIADAVERTRGLILQFLDHLDALSLESDQSLLDHHLRKTQLLRQHLASVMWLLIAVSDQSNLRGS